MKIKPRKHEASYRIPRSGVSTAIPAGNKAGNYAMHFNLEQCNRTIDHYFNLEITDKNSPNLTNIIVPSAIGTLLTVGTILAFKYKDKIKSYFKSNEGKQNNEVEKQEDSVKNEREEENENSSLSERKQDPNVSWLILKENKKSEIPRGVVRKVSIEGLENSRNNANERE